MAAGKTTVGQAAAASLGWPFHDNDTDVQAATGSTAREMLRAGGRARLHAIEREQLLLRLADAGPSVIAAAASTVEDPACRRALARPSVLVAWLRAAPATLAARFERGGDHRPRYGQDRVRTLVDQAARREPFYASLQPIVIDVDDVAVEAVVDRLVQAVRGRWPSAP